MKENPLIDYAAPMMSIEKMLKDLHNLLLDNKFDEGLELSLKITTECRLLTQTLKIMGERR